MPYAQRPLTISQSQETLLKRASIERDGPVSNTTPNWRITEGTNHLIIGIGGRGVDAVKKIKKEIWLRTGGIPKEKIAFLCFDTALNEIDDITHDKAQYALSNEIVPINGAATVQSWLDLGDQMPEHIKKLFPENFQYKTLRAALGNLGAGQKRLLGKLYFMDPRNQQRIDVAIDSAKGQIGFGAGTKIHIISGIGGGTGSGIMLDMAYKLRRAFNGSSIYGYILLSNSYRHWPDDSLKTNGYAFLKELDYYMSLSEGHDKYTIDYGGGKHEESDNDVFETCTLIGGDKANMAAVADRLVESTRTTVELLMNRIAQTEVMEAQGAVTLIGSYESNIRAHSDNTIMYISGVSKDSVKPLDRKYWYTVSGSSMLTIPSKEIVALAIGNIMEGLADKITSNTVDTQIVDKFESRVGLKPELIRRKLDTEITSALNAILEEASDNKREFSHATDGLKDAARNIVNAKCSGQSASDRINAVAREIGRAFENECRDAFIDIKRGPVYLSDIFSKATDACSGLNLRMERYNAECTDIVNKYSIESSSADITMSEEVSRISKIGGQRHMEAWKEAFVKKYRADYISAVLIRFQSSNVFSVTGKGSVISQLKESSVVYKELSDTLLVLADVIIGDRGSAKRAFGPDNSQSSGNNMFALDSPNFQNVARSAYDYINTTYSPTDSDRINALFAAITSSMLDNPTRWLSTDNLNGLNVDKARDFFGKQFGELTGRTLIDYIDEAFRGQSAGVCNSFISEIYKNLLSDSSPMIDSYPHLISAGGDALAGNAQVVTAVRPKADANTVWFEAFDCAEKGKNIKPAIATDGSTISMIKLIDGLPLWTCRQLSECERVFNASTDQLVYTNGSPEINWWAYPSPIPVKSWRYISATYSNPVEIREIQKARELFEKAKAAGIIIPPADGCRGYKVNCFSDNSQNTLENVKGCIVSGYASDAANFDNSLVSFRRGAPLYNFIYAKYGNPDSDDENSITDYFGQTVENDEDAINILRIRRGLYRDIVRSINVYNFACGVLVPFDDEKAFAINAGDFASFYRAGLIVPQTKQVVGQRLPHCIFAYKDIKKGFDGNYIENPEIKEFTDLTEAMLKQQEAPAPDQKVIHMLTKLPTLYAFEQFFSLPNVNELRFTFRRYRTLNMLPDISSEHDDFNINAASEVFTEGEISRAAYLYSLLRGN